MASQTGIRRPPVIPAKAGIQRRWTHALAHSLDSRFRGNDAVVRGNDAVVRGNDGGARDQVGEIGGRFPYFHEVDGVTVSRVSRNGAINRHPTIGWRSAARDYSALDVDLGLGFRVVRTP